MARDGHHRFNGVIKERISREGSYRSTTRSQLLHSSKKESWYVGEESFLRASIVRKSSPGGFDRKGI